MSDVVDWRQKTLVGNPPAAKLLQRRAAELSGLTHSAISTIEQDKVSPAISTLQKLLKVWSVTSGILFEPENLMSRRSSLIRTT